jgi:DNA-binding winged helix-turn-helix (wHTH) protein
MPAKDPPQVMFGPFRLDRMNRRLHRGLSVVPLRPKAFAVLEHLVTRAGRLVTKDQLLAAVWPNTAVTDTVLKVCVREIRDVLGDDPAAPRFVETAHRLGYRFVGQTPAQICRRGCRAWWAGSARSSTSRRRLNCRAC